MTALAEQCRPRALADVVGHDKAKAILGRLIARGIGGRALWISGPSGTGKTTLARIAAGMIADPFCTVEIDASELTAQRLRDLADVQHLYGLTKPGRAFIVNEAHGLRADTIRRLLVLLDDVPAHVLWCFTTTKDGQDELFDDHADAGPLLSRCVSIPLSSYGLAESFARHAKAIAEREGLDGQPIDRYRRLVRDSRTNLRAVFQAIESGAML